MEKPAQKNFQEFFDFCQLVLSGENPKFLELIRNRYNECDEEFRQSESMASLLQETKFKMDSEKSRLFVHLKSFLTSLKNRRKHKKGSTDGNKTRNGRVLLGEILKKKCVVVLENILERIPLSCTSEIVDLPSSPSKRLSKQVCVVTDGCLQSAHTISVADEAQYDKLSLELRDIRSGSDGGSVKSISNVSFCHYGVLADAYCDSSITSRPGKVCVSTKPEKRDLISCASSRENAVGGICKDSPTIHPNPCCCSQETNVTFQSPNRSKFSKLNVIEECNRAGCSTISPLHTKTLYFSHNDHYNHNFEEESHAKSMEIDQIKAGPKKFPRGDGLEEQDYCNNLTAIQSNPCYRSEVNFGVFGPKRIRASKTVIIEEYNTADFIILPRSDKDLPFTNRNNMHAFENDVVGDSSICNEIIKPKPVSKVKENESEISASHDDFSIDSVDSCSNLCDSLEENNKFPCQKRIKVSKPAHNIMECNSADFLILPFHSPDKNCRFVHEKCKTNFKIDLNDVGKLGHNNVNEVLSVDNDVDSKISYFPCLSVISRDVKSIASSLSETDSIEVAASQQGLEQRPGRIIQQDKERETMNGYDDIGNDSEGQLEGEASNNSDSSSLVPIASVESNVDDMLEKETENTENSHKDSDFLETGCHEADSDSSKSPSISESEKDKNSSEINTANAEAEASVSSTSGNVEACTLSSHNTTNSYLRKESADIERNSGQEDQKHDLSIPNTKNCSDDNEEHLDLTKVTPSHKSHPSPDVKRKFKRVPIITLSKIDDVSTQSKLAFMGSLSLHSKSDGTDVHTDDGKTNVEGADLCSKGKKSHSTQNLRYALSKPSTSRDGAALSEDEFETKPSSFTPVQQSSLEEQDKLNRHVQRLEKVLEKLRNEIEKCQNRELSLDDLDAEDSHYMYEDRYKKKFVACWARLCELKKQTVATGRPTERKIRYDGTRYKEINRRLERFLNKDKIFPDFHDVKNIVKKTNKKYRINLSVNKINEVSREAFVDIGKMLQKRRHEDFIASFGTNQTDVQIQAPDPALYDANLRKRLESNRKIAKTNLENIIEKFTQMQHNMDSDKNSCSEEEEEEEEDPDPFSRRAVDEACEELTEEDEDVPDSSRKKKTKKVVFDSDEDNQVDMDYDEPMEDCEEVSSAAIEVDIACEEIVDVFQVKSDDDKQNGTEKQKGNIAVGRLKSLNLLYEGPKGYGANDGNEEEGHRKIEVKRKHCGGLSRYSSQSQLLTANSKPISKDRSTTEDLNDLVKLENRNSYAKDSTGEIRNGEKDYEDEDYSDVLIIENDSVDTETAPLTMQASPFSISSLDSDGNDSECIKPDRRDDVNGVSKGTPEETEPPTEPTSVSCKGNSNNDESQIPVEISLKAQPEEAASSKEDLAKDSTCSESSKSKCTLDDDLEAAVCDIQSKVSEDSSMEDCLDKDTNDSVPSEKLQSSLPEKKHLDGSNHNHMADNENTAKVNHTSPSKIISLNGCKEAHSEGTSSKRSCPKKLAHVENKSIADSCESGTMHNPLCLDGDEEKVTNEKVDEIDSPSKNESTASSDDKSICVILDVRTETDDNSWKDTGAQSSKMSLTGGGDKNPIVIADSLKSLSETEEEDIAIATAQLPKRVGIAVSPPASSKRQQIPELASEKNCREVDTFLLNESKETGENDDLKNLSSTISNIPNMANDVINLTDTDNPTDMDTPMDSDTPKDGLSKEGDAHSSDDQCLTDQVETKDSSEKGADEIIADKSTCHADDDEVAKSPAEDLVIKDIQSESHDLTDSTALNTDVTLSDTETDAPHHSNDGIAKTIVDGPIRISEKENDDKIDVESEYIVEEHKTEDDDEMLITSTAVSETIKDSCVETGKENKQCSLKNDEKAIASNKETVEEDVDEEEDVFNSIAKLCETMITEDADEQSVSRGENIGKSSVEGEVGKVTECNSDRLAEPEKYVITDENGEKVSVELINAEGEEESSNDIEDGNEGNESSARLGEEKSDSVDDESEQNKVNEANCKDSENLFSTGISEKTDSLESFNHPNAASKEVARDEVGKLLEEARNLRDPKKTTSPTSTPTSSKNSPSQPQTANENGDDLDLEITCVEFKAVRRGRPPKSSYRVLGDVKLGVAKRNGYVQQGHTPHASLQKPVAFNRTQQSYSPQTGSRGSYPKHTTPSSHKFKPSTQQSASEINWNLINASIAPVVQNVQGSSNQQKPVSPYTSVPGHQAFGRQSQAPPPQLKPHSRDPTKIIPRNAMPAMRHGRPHMTKPNRPLPNHIQSLGPRVPIPSLHHHSKSFVSSSPRAPRSSMANPSRFSPSRGAVHSPRYASFHPYRPASHIAYTPPSQRQRLPVTKPKLDGVCMVLEESDDEDLTKSSGSNKSSIPHSRENKRKFHPSDSVPRPGPPKKPKTSSGDAIVLSDSE